MSSAAARATYTPNTHATARLFPSSATPLQTEISIRKGVNFGYIVVSAYLGYLLPEPFTYALYFVIAIV